MPMQGRPSKLTSEVTEQIASLVREGVPPSAAGERIGVSRATVNEWLRRGEDRDDRPTTCAFATFATEIRRAEASFLATCLAPITAAAQAGDWKASLALLERRFPNHFSPRREATPERGEAAAGLTLRGLAALLRSEDGARAN